MVSPAYLQVSAPDVVEGALRHVERLSLVDPALLHRRVHVPDVRPVLKVCVNLHVFSNFESNLNCWLTFG